MTKKELLKWRLESVEQAYAALEMELLIQYSGFVTFERPEDN